MSWLWQPIPAAAVDDGVSGTATTSQAQTVAGSGTYTPGPVTGTCTTSQAQTASASGTVTPPVTGTATTSQAQTVAGSGTFTPGAVTGTASTSQAQTVAGSGTSSPAITGTATTSQAQSTSGAGTVGGETPIDTHDGDAWIKYRKKLEKIVNLADALEVVKESPKEAIGAIQESDVKPSVKAKVSKVDYSQVVNNLKLQQFIARQLMIVVELQRIAQEDEDLMTFMMMD